MKLPQITRQAESETGAGETEAAKSRKKVSVRDFLGPDGAVVDTMELAAGARYALLVPGEANHNFDQQFGEAGKIETMCAVFGWHTKLGNVANTVLNAAENAGNPEAPTLASQELTAYIAQLAAGVWREPGKGGVGIAVNKDALAEAIVQFAEANGKTIDKAKVRQKVDDDPKWSRAMRQDDAVAKLYAAIVGTTPAKSASELLADLG